jgi:hypothetical protein
MFKIGQSGEWRACEVYWLNFNLFKCAHPNEAIVMLWYANERRSFIVCQVDGRVTVLGVPMKQLEYQGNDPLGQP